MSPYRIGGGIAALVVAVLLLIVTVRWVGHTDLVWPKVSVTPEAQSNSTVGQSAGGAASAQSPATAVLAERTQLQSDENTKPPSGENENLVFEPGVPNGESIARGWLQAPPEQLLTPPREVSGLSSLPYRNAERLEQPQGRDWRSGRNVPLRFGGSWLIFGVGLALALFLFARGRVRIAEGPSGETVPRFSATERANHWMTASAFIVMALTGLVILYGRPVLLPLIGEHGLGQIAWWSAWLHSSAAVPFVLGVIIMTVLWLRENLITRLDLAWLRRFGGFLNDDPRKPSAHRFNAGQKLVFWGVLLGGIATLASGVTLMFPFYWFGYDGMQWAQLMHAVVALLLIALIIGHIYIGTVGMEGAVDAMWSGRVDRNWAKEHHDLWYASIEREQHRRPSQPAAPAE
jgi:formate dehydrogenase subunit gamma